MKRLFISILFIFELVLVSCAMNTAKTDDSQRNPELISMGTWNVQTFFDSEVDGTEYSDFQNLAKWSKDKYISRLGRLCDAMKSLNADIFVLEEIENTAVVQDIANQLAGNSWNKDSGWNYACFAKETDSAIGCAVFSRFELKDLKIHSICVKTQGEEQPSVRPLMQVSVDVGGKELKIFVNHWKSKSGGEIASEIWRDWQESVVADVMEREIRSNTRVNCVLCGDFNRDAKEFSGEFPEVLFRGGHSSQKVFSPWFTASGDYSGETGSYYFDGHWERIDHVFTYGDLKISAFGPRTDGPWCNVGGVPNSYKLYSGEGYSDHLPLMCVLTLE